MGGLVNEAGRDKAPDTPSYTGAADTEYQSKVQSAIMNALLNRPNESNPLGSRTWSQTGSTNVGGQNIPQFGASTTANPQVQKLLDLGFGSAAAARSQPLSFAGVSPQYNEESLLKNRDAVTNAMYSRSKAMLDPRYEQEENRERTRLANQGFQVGNEGYDKAIGNFTRGKDAAYADAADRALLAGGAEQSRLFDLGQQERQQGISEIMTQRNQPTAELNSAVSLLPGYQNFAANSAIDSNDWLKATQQQHAADQNMYNLENQRSGMLGGSKIFSSFGK